MALDHSKWSLKGLVDLPYEAQKAVFSVAYPKVFENIYTPAKKVKTWRRCKRSESFESNASFVTDGHSEDTKFGRQGVSVSLCFSGEQTCVPGNHPSLPQDFARNLEGNGLSVVSVRKAIVNQRNFDSFASSVEGDVLSVICVGTRNVDEGIPDNSLSKLEEDVFSVVSSGTATANDSDSFTSSIDGDALSIGSVETTKVDERSSDSIKTNVEPKTLSVATVDATNFNERSPVLAVLRLPKNDRFQEGFGCQNYRRSPLMCSSRASSYTSSIDGSRPSTPGRWPRGRSVERHNASIEKHVMRMRSSRAKAALSSWSSLIDERLLRKNLNVVGTPLRTLLPTKRRLLKGF